MAGIWFPGYARRLLGGVGALLLVTVLAACGADGHEPGATDLASVTAIVDRLAVSEDPRREFSELPGETRQAVVDHLTVEKIASAGLSGPPMPTDAPAGCERQAAGYVARNVHGRDLWTYVSSTEWCWADGLISAAPVVTTGAEIHAPLWEFAGHIHQHETGGQGEASHSDWTRGVFRLCPADPDECVQEEEVLVVKWQRGDGGYEFDIEPIVSIPDPYARETTPVEAGQPLVGIAYTLLIVVPICAAAFSVGWAVRRSSARGSLAWGLGVIVTAWGVSIALEYGFRILVFDLLPPAISGFLVFSIYSSILHPLPAVAAALSAGWVMWKAAPRGSVTWGLGVVGLAFGTFSALKGFVPVLAFLPAFFGSPGGPVVTTEVVIEDVPVEVAEARFAARDKFRIEDGECGPHTRGIEGRGLFGQKLWTFQSETRWCWNGAEAGKDPSISPTVSAYVDAHVPFWSSGFPGNDVWVDESELPWELSDRATETVRLCLPLLQCVHNGFAVVEKRQFSDGTATVDYPSLTDPSQRSPVTPALELLPSIVMSTAALAAGWVLLRRSRRGSAAWGLGVIAGGLGALVPVLMMIVGIFFLTTSYTVF